MGPYSTSEVRLAKFTVGPSSHESILAWTPQSQLQPPVCLHDTCKFRMTVSKSQRQWRKISIPTLPWLWGRKKPVCGSRCTGELRVRSSRGGNLKKKLVLGFPLPLDRTVMLPWGNTSRFHAAWLPIFTGEFSGS